MFDPDLSKLDGVDSQSSIPSSDPRAERIRSLIEQGCFAEASTLLGARYVYDEYAQQPDSVASRFS